jgi:anti-sigma factor RsiW
MTPRWTPTWLPWRRGGGPALSCRELVELVTDHLEGALGAGDRVRFEAHIAGCAHCTAYLEQMRITLSVMGDLHPGALMPDTERELLDAFKDWKAGGDA